MGGREARSRGPGRRTVGRGRRRVGARLRKQLGRWLRAHPRRAWPLAAMGVAVVVLSTPWLACMGGPPSDADDICSIFREKRSWHRDAVRAHERWGVPESVQLAIIYQESSFQSRARPPRRRILGFLPGPRPSSAYGYGQVVDSTWDTYRNSTRRADASRDDFSDVSDFIGWYVDRIHRRTGLSKTNATELYAAYHEGPGGYTRGTHLSKPTVSKVAVRVGHRAARYQQQFEICREELSRRRFLWIF